MPHQIIPLNTTHHATNTAQHNTTPTHHLSGHSTACQAPQSHHLNGCQPSLLSCKLHHHSRTLPPLHSQPTMEKDMCCPRLSAGYVRHHIGCFSIVETRQNCVPKHTSQKLQCFESSDYKIRTRTAGRIWRGST